MDKYIDRCIRRQMDNDDVIIKTINQLGQFNMMGNMMDHEATIGCPMVSGCC